jgi:hypothetical protein
MRSIVLFVVLFVSTFCASPPHAGAQHCADQRAVAVGDQEVSTGRFKRCRLGLHIGPFEITIDGPRCPQGRLFTPAHGDCRGGSPGTECKPGMQLGIEAWKCHCIHVGSSGAGFDLPFCHCTFDGFRGFVVDYSTAPCAPKA